RSPPGYREASAGELADSRGTGLLALRGPADQLASLVDRPAAAARFQPRDGRVPGHGQVVSKPGANPADELAGRPGQLVPGAAVAPGPAAPPTRPCVPR